MKYCKNCGAELTDGAKYCFCCGVLQEWEISIPAKHCNHCGAPLQDKAPFCNGCGKKPADFLPGTRRLPLQNVRRVQSGGLDARFIIMMIALLVWAVVPFLYQMPGSIYIYALFVEPEILDSLETPFFISLCCGMGLLVCLFSLVNKTGKVAWGMAIGTEALMGISAITGLLNKSDGLLESMVLDYYGVDFFCTGYWVVMVLLLIMICIGFRDD